MNRTAGCLPLIVTALAAPPSWGAGLRIALNPGAEVVEADQRAMIAWNGTEEILVLSSDLTADEPTTVLEILPLPSRPSVTKGDAQIFHRATNVINQRINRVGGSATGKPYVLANFASGGGELVENKEIGPHHVGVFRVTDRKRFIPWLEEHLKGAGREGFTFSPLTKRTINEYLQDGYAWFVFDFIELDRTTGTADAIRYRFPAREVYFPMRVLRTREDLDSLRLLMLTPQLLHIPDLPPARVRLAHEPIRITAEELRYISKDMDQLLGHRPNMFLRVWSITGRLGAVRRDLVTGWWR